MQTAEYSSVSVGFVVEVRIRVADAFNSALRMECQQPKHKILRRTVTLVSSAGNLREQELHCRYAAKCVGLLTGHYKPHLCVVVFTVLNKSYIEEM